MRIEGEGKLLRIFIGESDRWHGKPLYQAIVERRRDPLDLLGRVDDLDHHRKVLGEPEQPRRVQPRVGAEGREPGFATVRVATNLGALAGPPLGALLVYLGGWNAFLLGIAALGMAGAILTAVLIREAQPARASERQGSLREVLRDRPFALLLLSALLAFTDYCGFETVLPVIAVSMYGLAPSTWGLLFVISPALVVIGQLRLTRATARIPPGPRLAAATLLMGLPFLLFLASTSVAVIAAVIAAFILGEMVWMPTSQAVAAEIAPMETRGTYFGALAAMTGPAWTLAPFIAFQIGRAHV